jgi:hypothetical protein
MSFRCRAGEDEQQHRLGQQVRMGGVERGQRLALFHARAPPGMKLDPGVGIDRLTSPLSRPAPSRCTAQPRAVVSMAAMNPLSQASTT